MQPPSEIYKQITFSISGPLLNPSVKVLQNREITLVLLTLLLLFDGHKLKHRIRSINTFWVESKH